MNSNADSETMIADGALVRSTSALYRGYGVGRVQKVRNGQAKVEFNPSVIMAPPYRSENKILALAEVERVDSPLDRAAHGAWEEPWRFELRMLAARLLTGNQAGQLSNSRTEILPHQIFTAHRVVSSPRRRFLLADEVGLGKTVEAGMVWQALAQRGQAKRTRIITPAGLTTQWQEEMEEKFGARFEVFGRDFLAVNPRVWDYKAQAIASIHRLKRAEHKRVLLENRLNKQTQQEIADAVERAKRAYEIATQSLFRDVSNYSFDKYQRELATDLTLDDLRRFTERFLAAHRRQLQRKPPFCEFIRPDVLKSAELPERVRTATFDRDLAIQRSDAEFLALGHPVVDAMLAHVGTYDFGGSAAVRDVSHPPLAGRSGSLFLFVIRQRIAHETGDECLFHFRPVFVRDDGTVDDEAVGPAVTLAAADVPVSDRPVPDPRPAFEQTKAHLERSANFWDWDDDVEFLGLSWVMFR